MKISIQLPPVIPEATLLRQGYEGRSESYHLNGMGYLSDEALAKLDPESILKHWIPARRPV